MSKASKIVLIIVAVLVAIGAAIGIYFAVKGRNPYTKEQQAFIDEIINSNKPNNPPVDIGGGTLPGGVVGEDETGDTVIVDTGTGSDEIWQKDPTDPDGGYDKVETPTTDDEGQPFTYQTVVQVCGNFALVQNDVGNHAVINLAESKVVLNYTDLQDAENLKIAGDVLFFTTPYVLVDSIPDSIELYHVFFVSLREAKQAGEMQTLKAQVSSDCVYKITWLNIEMIAVQGIENYQILKLTDGAIQIVYEILNTEFLQFVKKAEEIDEDNDILSSCIIIGSALYKEKINISITKLNEEYFFINTSLKLDEYQQNTFCFYYEMSGFSGYIAPQYYLLNENGEISKFGVSNEVYVPQNVPYENYIVFLKYNVVSDAVLYKTILNSSAVFVYYHAETLQEIIKTPYEAGIIVDFNADNQKFVTKNASYYYIDSNGNVSDILDGVKILNYSTLSNIMGGYSAVSTYAVYKKSGEQITGFVYEELYGPVNNIIVGERHQLVYDESIDDFVEEIYYDFIDYTGVIQTISAEEMKNSFLLDYGIYIMEKEGVVSILKTTGDIIVADVQQVQVVTCDSQYYINYEKENLAYTYKLNSLQTLFVRTSINASGVLSLEAVEWEPVPPTTENYKNIEATDRETEVKVQTKEIKKKNAGSFTITKTGIILQINDVKKADWGYYYGHEAILSPESGYFIRGYAETYKNFFSDLDAVIIGNEKHEYFNLNDSAESFKITGDDNIFKHVGLYYWYQVAYNTFTVKLQGGTGRTSFQSASISSMTNAMENGDTKTTISVPEREGYRFTGFYTSPSSKGTKIFNADGTLAGGEYTTTKGGDITLYAGWEALVTEVTFKDYAGGSFTENYAYDQLLMDTSVSASDKIGYDFAGWYTKENGKGVKLFDKYGNSIETEGYIRKETGIFISRYYWDRDYDYNTTGANKITLYAYYEPKNMNVQVDVVAEDDGVETGQLRYALLGGNWDSTTSKTYLYDATKITNRIQIQMSEALGYYISKFEITWKTFNNDNELKTSLSGASDTYKSLDATNGINKNVIEKSISGQTVAIIPNKTVSGNTATYSFDFKSGTGQDSSYLNTWEVVLTIYINIDLSITPPDTVQTSAESINIEPVILPQNRKEEA